MNTALKKLGRFLSVQKRKAILKNHRFTIISNTCIGGVITHNVGEQFRSPTVNLIIYEDQFLTYCEHLKEYSNCPVEKPSEAEKKQFQNLNYPVGILRGSKYHLPDINLLFVHYKSYEEAADKWYIRSQRIDYDNIYVIMDRGLEASEEILDRFYKLPYKHKVFFTDRIDNSRWPGNFKFSFYDKNYYKSGCLYNNIRKGIYLYHWLDEFNYVKWLNEDEISNSKLRIIK